MAVTLPTLTVTDPQAQLIAAALEVPLENATPNYLAWLTNSLIDLVETKEVDKIRRSHNQAMESAIAALRASLPARVTPPQANKPIPVVPSGPR